MTFKIDKRKKKKKHKNDEAFFFFVPDTQQKYTALLQSSMKMAGAVQKRRPGTPAPFLRPTERKNKHEQQVRKETCAKVLPASF